jgi:molybdate-binding protein
VGAGEDDPALSRLLDQVERPRYLADGSRAGVRRLEDGITDIAVCSGPVEPPTDATEVGSWSREWGLLVPEGNPDAVEGLDSLVAEALSFVNRPRDSGLRATFDAALAALDSGAVADDISGYERAARAHESPARMVARGDVDVGLGLRVSAAKLGLGFVSVGSETVRVVAAGDRAGKPGVDALATAIEEGAVFDSLAGYEP